MGSHKTYINVKIMFKPSVVLPVIQRELCEDLKWNLKFIYIYIHIYIYIYIYIYTRVGTLIVATDTK